MEFRDYIDAVVEEKIQEIIVGDSDVVKQLKKISEEDAKVELYKRLIENHGRINSIAAKKYELSDLITSPEFSYFFPKVITKMAGEVFENQLVITSLLEEIEIDPGPSLTIQIPQFIGAFGQDLDVGEAGEYPELTLKVAGGAIATVTIGKAGVAVSITEEAIKYSRFDILNQAIKEALKALARWKEKKALRMFYESKKNNPFKTGGSGVDVTGNPNGGLSLDDIVDVAVAMMEKGFNLDTLIMHPLAYPIFAKNGTLRSFFFRSMGDVGYFYNWPTVKGGQPEIYERMGKTRNLEGRNIVEFELPTGILGKPLRLILSPAVAFDKTTKTTDIIFVDSSNVGYLVTAERPTTEEFNDPMRDLRHLKIRERYGMAPKYDGSAIEIIKNVKVVETFEPLAVYTINR